MERLGVPLDMCHLLGWHNVASYCRNLATVQGTHLWRHYHKEENDYASPLHIAAMIADAYDLIQAFYITMSTPAGKAPRKLKPYPRPWNEQRSTFGKGAIPVRDFDAWYYGGE